VGKQRAKFPCTNAEFGGRLLEHIKLSCAAGTMPSLSAANG
jgi:hypothetical protein